MKEDDVLQALRALAEDDREKEAPPQVEARLLGAYRLQHARRARRFHRIWSGIAALAAALVIALLLWSNRVSKPAWSAPPAIAQLPEATGPVAVAPATAIVRTPRRFPGKVAAARQPRVGEQVREVVTDFFPLMNPAPSFGRGQMLRVQLPAAAMQTVGLPVREENLGDLVQADVLVGEEGMPRAIRFVTFDVR